MTLAPDVAEVDVSCSMRTLSVPHRPKQPAGTVIGEPHHSTQYLHLSQRSATEAFQKVRGLIFA
jgi:hypothetical protein